MTDRRFDSRVDASADPQIFVIHENDAWLEPLRAALAERSLPFQEWYVAHGVLDTSRPPPNGVFYNRMSASSHTRDHRYAAELTAATLAWLTANGRRVLNGERAMQLEISKVAQYQAFEACDILAPRTVATVGTEALLDAATSFDGSFITKHNRAGKGLGVRLFHSVEALQQYVVSPEFEHPVDGITLLQQYVLAPEPFITRVEFVGREFVYAVRVDTSEGFELCPADACAVGDQMCPVGSEEAAPAKFQLVDGFTSPLIEKYQRFMREHDIHVAAFEHIVDKAGTAYTYDMNVNTNYNRSAEEAAGGPFGMGAVADYLGAELAALASHATSRVG